MRAQHVTTAVAPAPRPRPEPPPAPETPPPSDVPPYLPPDPGPDVPPGTPPVPGPDLPPRPEAPPAWTITRRFVGTSAGAEKASIYKGSGSWKSQTHFGRPPPVGLPGIDTRTVLTPSTPGWRHRPPARLGRRG